jgi:hypothetical protein
MPRYRGEYRTSERHSDAGRAVTWIRAWCPPLMAAVSPPRRRSCPSIRDGYRKTLYVGPRPFSWYFRGSSIPESFRVNGKALEVTLPPYRMRTRTSMGALPSRKTRLPMPTTVNLIGRNPRVFLATNTGASSICTAPG